MENESLNLVQSDPWLKPYEAAINGRHNFVLKVEKELTTKTAGSLSEFASGYLFLGLHKTTTGWIFREWAPHATKIFIVGDFNNWKEIEKYELSRKDHGIWELKLAYEDLKHGDFYKMKVYWDGGSGERIPAWCRRVVQDTKTQIFSAQVWEPENPYKFKNEKFKADKHPLLIYECHIGMAQDARK